MLKKTLFIVSFLLALSFEVWAQPDITFGNATGNKGDTVSIPVTFINDGTVTRLGFFLEFNNAEFFFAGLNDGSALPPHVQMSFDYFNPTSGEAGFNGSINAPFDQNSLVINDGEILTFALRINTSASPGDYPLTITVGFGNNSVGIAIPDQIVSSIITINAIAPNVVGQNQATAETSLQNEGLIVGQVSTQNSDSITAGVVISQSPAASTTLAPGSTVDLVVSAGPIPFAMVPDVTGLSVSAATPILQNAGLTVGMVTQQANAALVGNIISQYPAVGTSSVVTGSSVNLIIASPIVTGNTSPKSIPTLSEWSLILLSLLMAMIVFYKHTLRKS